MTTPQKPAADPKPLTAAEIAKLSTEERQEKLSALTQEAQALRGIPDSSRTEAQKARLVQIAEESKALGG